MISNLVSLFISSKLQRKPIYEELAHQDGIHLPTAETRQQGGQRQVSQAMRPATDVLRAEISVREAMETTDKSTAPAWVVCDEKGVRGVLSRNTLEEAARQGSAAKSLSELLPGEEFVHVHADHPLNMALERLGASQLGVLPVVSRADVHQL